jgi:methyltransferase (TIGR00027 family)
VQNSIFYPSKILGPLSLILLLLLLLGFMSPSSPSACVAAASPHLDLSLSQDVRDTANLIASSRAAISAKFPLFLNDTYAKLFTGAEGGRGVTTERNAKSLSRIGCRTRFFDCFLSEAIHGELKAEQVLILGTGFDTRALRLRCLQMGNVRVFEVDQPETITAKAAIMKEAGHEEEYERSSVKVGADLLQRTWIHELRRRGFDPKKRTCIIVEGLLYYFEETQATDLLKTCRELVDEGVGSSILFSAVSENCVGGMNGLFRWGR